MMSNGRLFSRVGTALVAMEANEADKPVLVLCETIKFTERVALDSIVHNEMAPADELVIPGGPSGKMEGCEEAPVVQSYVRCHTGRLYPDDSDGIRNGSTNLSACTSQVRE